MKALSIKQPWATLVVYGLKTIEVRRWPTARLGRVLIHTGRDADERDEALQHLPPHLAAAARLHGGIVGAATLVRCFAYKTEAQFAADQERHFNDPSWFHPPLFGFEFADAEPLPFRPCLGQVRFFEVEDIRAD